MLKFYVKLFRTSLFPNPMMDLVNVWYDDGYCSKILQSTVPTPIHDLKVKDRDLELLCSNFMLKVFRTSLFLNYVVYLFHVWHDDRCCSTIPNLYMTLRSRSWT